MNLWQKFTAALFVSDAPAPRTKASVAPSSLGAASARPPSVSGARWGHLQWSNTAGGSDRDWKGEAGRLQDNSAVSILLGTICNNFADSPLCVRRFDPETGTYLVVPDHDLAKLLKRPNPSWTRTQLFRAIITSLYLDGNAYVFKARNSFGKVCELWWLPHNAVTVITDPTGAVVSYRYQTLGNVTFYDPSEIIHLKIGVNTERPELGESPLRALLREICTDNEVMNYTFSILKNLGVPGVVFTPKTVKLDGEDSLPEINQPLIEKVKRTWKMLTTGDHRGEALVMTTPWDIATPGFKPSELLIDKVGQLAEVRIAGAFGVPVVVVQFLSGLQNVNAKASYKTCIAQLYGCCLIPLQRMVCEWLDLQLLPELGNPATEHFWFDHSEVTALQDNVNEVWKRAIDGFKAGILTRADAREMVQMKADDDDDAYIFQLQTLPMPAELDAPPTIEDDGSHIPDPTGPDTEKAAALLIAERWRRAGFEAPEVEALQ